MESPDIVTSRRIEEFATVEHEDYADLQRRYLEPQIRTGRDAELPAAGMRLRRRVYPAKIDTRPALKQKLEHLQRHQLHGERYRLLTLLREYETHPSQFHGAVPTDLTSGFFSSRNDPDDVSEIIQLDPNNNNNNAVSSNEVIELKEGDMEEDGSSSKVHVKKEQQEEVHQTETMDLPDWPIIQLVTNECVGYKEPDPAGAACKLLQGGGTWRSYAYEANPDCWEEENYEFSNQLLIAQNGGRKIQMVPVDSEWFYISKCTLKIEKTTDTKDLLAVVGHDGESFIAAVNTGSELENIHQGYTYSPLLVEPRRSFRIRTAESGDGIPPTPITLVTKENDMELTSEHRTILLRKETPEETKTRKQDQAASEVERLTNTKATEKKKRRRKR